jgi:hypothetical protein
MLTIQPISNGFIVENRAPISTDGQFLAPTFVKTIDETMELASDTLSEIETSDALESDR